MSIFLEKLLNKISSSVWNNYTDNYDESRFGKVNQFGIKGVLQKKINKTYISKYQATVIFESLSKISGFYKEQFQLLYDNLGDEQSKNLLIDIWAYRLLGYKLVKLPLNTPAVKQILKRIKTTSNRNETINPNFMHFRLNRFDFEQKGKKVSLYFTAEGILVDFFLEQYRYSSEDTLIEVKPGSVIIDGGGCWGDTAIYFGKKINGNGKVYSFEFIPSNIEIFRKNISLNPDCENNIELVPFPLWNESGKYVYFLNQGPGSKVSNESFEGYTGKTQTKTIDDLMEEKNIQQLDFIKLDIEGAEPFALQGSEKSIRKFKPDLAIAIYHSIDDFVNIPKWILDLGLGYKLYLGHYTIHSEETILFATVR